MVAAATYSAVETLRDGRRIDIRALRPTDRAELLQAVGRTSLQSLYRRFFAVKRDLTEQLCVKPLQFTRHPCCRTLTLRQADSKVQECIRPAGFMGSHQLDTLGVTGSSPVAPIYKSFAKRKLSVHPGGRRAAKSGYPVRGWGSQVQSPCSALRWPLR